MQKFLTHSFFIPGTIIVLSLVYVLLNASQLFVPYDAEKIGTAYSQSQYVLGDNAIEKIDDGTVYQYAAQAYVQGEDPTTINFEHPPLAKYLYGVSWLLTGSMLPLNIVFFAGVLLLTAQLFNQFSVPKWLQVLGLVYLAVFSSLDHHLTQYLLDLQTLFWSLAFFVVLFLKTESWKKYAGVGVVLGAFIATKYFFPIAFLYLGLLGIWALKKQSVLKAVLSVGIAGSIYLLSYAAYFISGHSPIDFIKFEWYRFKWWTGNRTIPKFIILDTLFTGSFPMWWSDAAQKMKDGDWNISWPIIFVAHLISLFFQKYSLEKVIIVLFSTGLFAIFMFGSAVYGRYLLQLIPFWLLLIGSNRYVVTTQKK